MDNATARAALTHVSKVVDSQRREYIMRCLLEIKESEDPLESMCAAGHDDQTELMQFLIENCRGDVNYKNEKGQTRLHAAARSGYQETVKLFLKYARDVNAHDNDGMTPLMCCVEAGREFISYEKNGRTIYGPYGKPDGHIETIRVLIRAGADVNARNNKGATAAAIAAEKQFSDIVAELGTDGSSVPSKAPAAVEPKKVPGLSAAPPDVAPDPSKFLSLEHSPVRSKNKKSGGFFQRLFGKG
jgi:ankyrin repeat protein